MHIIEISHTQQSFLGQITSDIIHYFCVAIEIQI